MIFYILIPLLVYFIYTKLIKPHYFWRDKGVLHIKPVPIFGNAYRVFTMKENMTTITQEWYNTFPEERYIGVYMLTMPILLIRDLDLLKQITVKDFDHFQDHSSVIANDVDPLWGKNLFASTGDYWRTLRPTLSPAFTSSKMKAMFTLMSDCSEQFTDYLLSANEPNLAQLDMKDIFTRFTNDVIATCAFGVKCDSLSDRENEFYLMGKEGSDISGIKGLKFMMNGMCPNLMKFFGSTLFSKNVSSFFRNLIKDTIDARERHKIIRPDMIHLLMEARKGKLKHEKTEKARVDDEVGFATVQESELDKSDVKTLAWSDDEIVAQALVFFIAGFETSSALMCLVAYELALNPEIQERLFREVRKSEEACSGKVTYEGIIGMKYLDMVITETLRKWPPNTSTDRVVTKPYTIQPVRSHERPLYLEKGDAVMINMYAIQRDPKYFPNPEKFDPERFSDEHKHKINQTAMLAFGIGPRSCIASRFAILENKVLFYHILKCFEFVITEKSPIPFVLSPKHSTISPTGGMWLGMKKR